MTNKEAKEKLYMEWQKFLEDNIDYAGISDAYKTAFKALEQEPCEDVAKERYEDLCEYFGGAKDILKHREDFKAWLGRVKWHIHKVEELSAENDDLRDQLAMRDRFQKQEPCEDAISRQAVLDNAYAYGNGLEPDGYCVNVEDIQALPPVTPQPKIGRWIRWYEQKEHDGCTEHIPHCKCSECGKEYDSHSSLFIKYCNECGARMVESEEGEDKK